MPHLLVGTAGHVDHGKTRLIEALTGIDCDRWSEEKTRGITIDLGFAHLEDQDLQIGFVDVPGHAKFLHNALAGLGGIRLVLLVVAADEGVKPQTREHIDICRLLEIPNAIVALTKIDLVEEDLRTLATDEVRNFLAAGPYAGIPVYPVSTLTGEGITEFKHALIRRARELAVEPEADSAVRLPVDRVFQLQGQGTIVTGTLLGGRIEPGMELQWGPDGGSARVRSIQVHGSATNQAVQGQRTALQLGGVSAAELSRGVQLFTPGTLRETTHLAARLELLADASLDAEDWTEVVIHSHSSETPGRARGLGHPLAAGEPGLVELRTHRPLLAVRGDHVILRRPSPPATLGGGIIADPFWRHRRGSRLERAVEALPEDRDTLVFWVRGAGLAGRSASDLAHRLGEQVPGVIQRLERLSHEGQLIGMGDSDRRRWITPDVLVALQQRAQSELAAYFRSHRLATGLSKAEATERILGARGRMLADAYIDWLSNEGVLVDRGDTVDLPGREDPLTRQESELASNIRRAFEDAALSPPSPADLRRQIGGKPQIVDGVIGYLIERGQLVRLSGGLILSATALRALRNDLLESDLETFTVGDFKSRYDLSRKWAIPLLEHLDSTGTTRRTGDVRVVVRR